MSGRPIAQSSLTYSQGPHSRAILHIGQIPSFVVDDILKNAIKFKRDPSFCDNLLARKMVALLVDSPSVRARLSFEVAAKELGGHATTYFVDDLPADLHSVTLSEAALVMSMYADCLAVCLDQDTDLDTVAEFCHVPVINAENTQGNPCEILADLMTIKEEKGVLSGLKIGYLGDLTSVRAYEMMRASCSMGMRMKGCGLYRHPGHLMKDRAEADEECQRLGHEGSMEIVADPIEAVSDADVVMGDVSSVTQFETGSFSIGLVRTILDRAEKGAPLLLNLWPEQACETIVAGRSGDRDRVRFRQTQNRIFVEKALLQQVITSPLYQAGPARPVV